MSVVTDHIIALIAKQVEDYKLVVWYDPEQAYKSVVDGHQAAQDHAGPL